MRRTDSEKGRPVVLGPDYTALIFRFFDSFFRFLELFIDAMVLPLIVFQTRQNEKNEVKRRKIRAV